MSREFVPTITPEMVNDGMFDAWEIDRIERDIFASPQFRAQLRAWAAEEMRGLVPEQLRESEETSGAYIWNTCRAETLANITAWEKANENE